jgi:GT2 family glycosyltransferase
MVTKFSGRHVEHPIMSDVYDVDVIPNAFMTTREVINRIGKFDEVNFPMQQEEEHDIQTRAKEMGYRVVINPKAKVWHDYPEERKLNSRLTPETIYYIWRNRIWHEKIHNRRRYATMSLFLPTYFLYYLLTIIESRKTLKEKSTCLVCMVKGMYSGIFRSPHTKHHV